MNQPPDPCDIAAEQAVLGAMMLSPATAEKIAGLLQPWDFYRMAHMQLFKAITLIMADGKIPDAVVVNGWLQGNPSKVVGVDAPYLHTLIASVPVVAQAEVYAATVRRHAVTRRLREAGTRVMQWTHDEALTADPTTLTEQVFREFEKVRAVSAGDAAVTPRNWHSFLDVPETADEYDWIIPQLLERGDRLILTGFEGIGKSHLFRQLAVMTACGIHPFSYARFDPRKVLLLDFENSERQTRRKLWPIVQTAISQGLSLEPENLWIECRISGVDLGTDKSVSWLIQQVTAIKPDIVFLGPLYKLAPRALNDDSDAAPILNALDMIRARGAAVVLEAHSGHAPAGGKRDVRVRGSAAFMGWPEFAYGLRWADGSDVGRAGGRRVVDFISWRGDRDERPWPEQLESGGVWPWSEVVTIPQPWGLTG